MLKTTLGFLLAGLIAACFIDIEISTLSPLTEIQNMGLGFLLPSFTRALEIWPALLKTIALATLSTAIAILIGSIAAFFYNNSIIRLFCTALRSIHELFWALLLIPLLGLTPLCGVIAIAIPFTGIFAKVFSEIADESNKSPRQGAPQNCKKSSLFIYTIFPVITPPILNYTRYRFECALRSSAVLGFLGIPTIGFYLETMFREGYYHQAAGLLFVFYALIYSLRYWLHPRSLAVVFVLSTTYLIWTHTGILDDTHYLQELTPWPLRSEQTFVSWFSDIWQLGGEGLMNTISLTQFSIVTTALLALCIIPFISSYFVSQKVIRVFQLILIVLRTTPELFIAYAFLILAGPSMLPAILALTLHNAAIMAHLIGGLCDKMNPPEGVYKRKIDAYFYFYLPNLFGQFLAFLFLRWEVMIRDSALLGIIGIYTIGFYIDSAISDDHMDRALALILLSGLLTLAVDSASHRIRKRLRLAGITTCVSQ